MSSSSSQWYSSFLTDLKAVVAQLKSTQVYVGYSGGVDSRLLLELACQCFPAKQVTAIHINHGLSARAEQWAQHCQQQCELLGCEFIGLQGNTVVNGAGIEAAARTLRYEKFAETIPEGGVLLLAHHLDDQVETFFLRLMRGAGVHGLKAMANLSRRDHYQLFRPLLSLSKAQLIEWAEHLGLAWIEDDSNDDVLLDRNYLRHNVLPMLEARWPAYRQRIQSSIDLLASGNDAAISQSFVVEQELQHRLSFDQGLKLVQLNDFSEAQVLSLLHAWLLKIGQQVPSKQRLKEIYRAVIHARADAAPEVRLGQGAIRRHGPAIYWVADMPEPVLPPAVSEQELQYWAGVGWVGLQVSADKQDPTLSLQAGLPNLNWRLRSGGEVIQPAGRSKSRDLKRLLQEYRVKPWLRYRIPLLYSGDQLVAVADLFVVQGYQAGINDPSLRLVWKNSANAD